MNKVDRCKLNEIVFYQLHSAPMVEGKYCNVLIQFIGEYLYISMT